LRIPASHCAISTNAENDVSSANDRRRSTRCFFSTHSYRSRYPTTQICRVTLTLYAVIKDLLDCFYPEREITVTTSDPRFVTPAVKAMSRRKNRLMHAGRVELSSLDVTLRGYEKSTLGHVPELHGPRCVTSLEAGKDMKVKSSMESRRKDLRTTTPLSQTTTTTVPLRGKCRYEPARAQDSHRV